MSAVFCKIMIMFPSNWTQHCTFQGGNGGRVVNVASLAGISVKPPRGPGVGGFDDVGYNASKHGVVTLTR